MDARRHLSAGALTLILGGCASSGDVPPQVITMDPAVGHPVMSEVAIVTPIVLSGPAAVSRSIRGASSLAAIPHPRPYTSAAPSPPMAERQTRADVSGRPAIAAANRQARAASSADAFVGGVQVFAWDPGRVYEVWTAPLRVTSLTLASGETVTAKAAGDTVRWQIGESLSGEGATARTHVLIKPLQVGLETNLVLTTNQRVYLLTLRSGGPEAFNAAIAWDYAVSGSSASPPVDAPVSGEVLSLVDVGAVTPQGPLDARYRIEVRGRTPRWTPTAVFNDGIRTFIALSPDVAVDEAPALFIFGGGEPQLVNYRQADGLLIVDRVFDEAELRLGDRRPQIVRIRRMTGGGR